MSTSRPFVAPHLGAEGVAGQRRRKRQPTSRLPRRALSLVRQRLFLGATLMAGLTLGNGALWLLTQPSLRVPPRLGDVLGLMLFALVLDGAMLRVSRGRRLGDEAMVSFGLAYHLLRTFAVALYSVRLEVLLGWEPSAVTFASATIATFPLLVPTPPLKTLVVSLAAGAMPPLVLWLHGASLPLLGEGIAFAAVSVALAVFCGQVAYGLSAAVARSDELGAYRLIERLSQGSAGALWRAEHRLLARPTAVKIIRPPWLVGRRFVQHLERFRREAQIATRLTSPHSVTVYDHGIADDGSFFYAREFLDGETLEQRVHREGPLPPLDVVRIALQVCDSLGEAHQLGLAHRRLSARQIFLCRVGARDDFVKVLDFGLIDLEQRLERDAVPRTEGRRVCGVEDCLAPETVARGVADARSDQYQLGCVLQYLLTGRSGPPSAHRGALEGVAPSAWLHLLERSVAEEPARRFPSIDAFAAALRDLLRTQLRGSTTPAQLVPLVSSFEPPFETLFEPPEGVASGPDERGTSRSSARSVDRGTSPRTAELSARSRAVARAMDVSRHRLERFAGLLAAATVLSLPILAFVDPYELSAVVALTGLLGISFALDVVLVLAARDRHLGGEAVIRLGAVYFVLRSSLLTSTAMVLGDLLGTGPARMSFVLVLLVIAPFLLAARPAQILIVALLGALAHPVALLTSASPVGTSELIAGMIDAVTVVVGAYACARLVEALRRSVTRDTYGVYRLTRLLANGAMGEVWRAEHDLLARPAAIKLIAPGTVRRPGGAALSARFEREARVTARLTSPHTVTLYDYGVSEDGTYYYVMELLEGQDLQDFVESHGPLPWQQALLVALEICDSLVEAHALGLVHRDLKPANVFLARIGRDPQFVKVLDFGLAELESHMRGDDDRHPRVVGTPGYIPPETLLEQGGDARSDLYQLGCVLFYLLTGRLVFERPSVTALAVAHVREDPPPVSEAAGVVVPVELEEVIARCLEKSPEDRFASAEELQRALCAVLVAWGPAWLRGGVSPDILPLAFEPGAQAWSAPRTL